MQVFDDRFHQPFLLQKELWYSLIPNMSYRDLINVFAVAKFTSDFSLAIQNFQIAKRIWCRNVCLVVLVNTLHQAQIKKANLVFFSIINLRNNNESNEDNFIKELLESIQSPLHSSDYTEKVAQIAIKAGYDDVFMACFGVENRLTIPGLANLICYASTCKEGLKFIEALLIVINQLEENDFEFIVSNWICLPGSEEKLALEEACLEHFDIFTVRRILSNACKNLYKKADSKELIVLDKNQKNVSKEIIDINTKLIINGLNFARGYDDEYSDLWTEILTTVVKSNQRKTALQILNETPFPFAKLKSFEVHRILCAAIQTNQTKLFNAFIDKFNDSDFYWLEKMLIPAFENGQVSIVRAIFNKIKGNINSKQFEISSALSTRYQKIRTTSTSDTESELQFNEKLKNCIPLIYRNTYIARKVLFGLSYYFAFPHDLQLSDFDLRRPLKLIQSDPDGKPLLYEDTGNGRVYICPEVRSTASKSLELIIMGPPIVIGLAIWSVVSQVFSLLAAICTLNKPKIQAHVVGIAITPIAFLGMEVALLAHFIFPEKACKLYYACVMSLQDFEGGSFHGVIYQPNFLHMPLPLESKIAKKVSV